MAKLDGASGDFSVAATDKSGRGFRGKGRLQYVRRHHLRFAGTKEYFLKAGPDAPETILACKDFDGTRTNKVALKTWRPHGRDWRKGDPTWKGGKGKGIVGAINYLAAKGCTAFSFLTYNAGGLGVERKLYLRELIARYGHELALNWDLGEENTQSPPQQRAMAKYIHDTDPHHRHIVVHTYPNAQDKVYPPLLGDQSKLGEKWG